MFRAAVMFMALSLVFLGGYAKGNWDAKVAAQADKTGELVVVIDAQDEINSESHDITRQWLEADAEREVVTEYIEVEVIKYVPQIQHENSVCNVSVGAECLLNARRTNLMPGADCRSITDAEKQAASKITAAALIQADIQCADRYTELAGKRDALIDVVDGYRKKLARMKQVSDEQ